MTERSPFKNLDEILCCDQRNTYIQLINRKTGQARPYDLDAHHAAIAKVTLGDAVPVAVKDQFNLAKNLCLYGWYVYDFGMAAKLYSYIALEAALKAKFEASTGSAPKRTGLASLIKWAVAEKLIVDGGFEHLYFAGDEALLKDLPDWSKLKIGSDRLGSEYSSGPFLTGSPSLRNSLGHGSEMLMPPYQILSDLKINADAINQLFP